MRARNDPPTLPAGQEPTSAPDGAPLTAAGGMREAEIRSMAAFRLREAANRIAALADSAADDGLRADLLALHARLLDAERALIDQARAPRPGR